MGISGSGEKNDGSRLIKLYNRRNAIHALHVWHDEIK